MAAWASVRECRLTVGQDLTAAPLLLDPSASNRASSTMFSSVIVAPTACSRGLPLLAERIDELTAQTAHPPSFGSSQVRSRGLRWRRARGLGGGQRALEGGPVGRPAVRREHVLDRQCE